MRKLTIATRGSRLALWQAEFIKSKLARQWPNLTIELLVLKTRGDVLLDVPLAKVGGKGLFVKEIEEALLDGRADVAVHSMKDVPMLLPEGLILSAVPEREDCRDIFLSHHYSSLENLPPEAVLGTSSLRRQALALALRPDLKVCMLRGNVETRLRKLAEGQYDGIILAAAGMKRLKLEAPRQTLLPPLQFLPAVGQGALGVEVKAQSMGHELTAFLDHLPTRLCVEAERAFLRALDGGCQVPIAAHASLEGEKLHLRGMVAQPDGSAIIPAEGQLPLNGLDNLPAIHAMGQSLAAQVLNAGGRAILETLYKGQA